MKGGFVIWLLLFAVLHLPSVLYPAGNVAVPVLAKDDCCEALVPAPQESPNLATIIDPNG